MKLEEVRKGMRVRNTLQPKITGFVRAIGTSELQRTLRLASLECLDCREIPGNLWADTNPPIPEKTCSRHNGAGPEPWVMVEWDIRKGLILATNPAALEPEINLRVYS